MGVFNLSPSVSDEFECEVVKPDDRLRANIHLVRPCERYKELYGTCSSWIGRIQQYYVYGEKLDCDQHHRNYTNCIKYRQTKDVNLLVPIIEWEQNLIRLRLKSAELNTVWQMRDKSPDDFNRPLPEHLIRK